MPILQNCPNAYFIGVALSRLGVAPWNAFRVLEKSRIGSCLCVNSVGFARSDALGISSFKLIQRPSPPATADSPNAAGRLRDSKLSCCKASDRANIGIRNGVSSELRHRSVCVA